MAKHNLATKFQVFGILEEFNKSLEMFEYKMEMYFKNIIKYHKIGIGTSCIPENISFAEAVRG